MPIPKRFRENRRLAAGIAAACAAFSILVMGPVKLNGYREEVAGVFRRGAYEDVTISAYTDIRLCAECAGKLAALAAGELDRDDENLAALKATAQEILAGGDEGQLLRAFDRLQTLADDVYARYLQKKPSKNDKKTAEGLYDDMQNARYTLPKDAYFALAEDFNADRSAFPARFLAKAAGIAPLPTEGGAQ